MFRFGFNNFMGYSRKNQVIEDKLSQNCELEDLLEEDEILQEVKNPSSKVLDKQQLKKLLDYIMVTPTDESHNKAFRFPFYASEILNQDHSRIVEYFFNNDPTISENITLSTTEDDPINNTDTYNKNMNENRENKIIYEETKIEFNEDKEVLVSIEDINKENNNNFALKNELLDQFLSFINTKSELNYVLSGYFARFFNTLISKNASLMLNYIYKNNPEFLFNILNHSNRKAILDILPKLIQIESFDCDLAKDPTVTRIRVEVLTEFVKKLKSEDPEEVNNSMSVLSEIIDNRTCLEIFVENNNILVHIYNIVTNPECKSINFNECLNLLILILKFCVMEDYKLPKIATNSDDSLVSYDYCSIQHNDLSILVKETFNSILYHFDLNKDLESKNVTYLNTTGIKSRPLGFKRSKIIEYVHMTLNFMKGCYKEMDYILGESSNNFLNLMFDYFFEFEWNNIYQNNFEILIVFFLSNIKHFQMISVKLFEQIGILNLLMEKSNYQYFHFDSNRRINHGYFAILVELCSKINSNSDKLLMNYITDNWKKFYSDKIFCWKELFLQDLAKNDEFKSPNNVEIEEIIEVINKDDSNENLLKENKVSSEEKPFNLEEFEAMTFYENEEQVTEESKRIQDIKDEEQFNDNIYWKTEKIQDIKDEEHFNDNIYWKTEKIQDINDEEHFNDNIYWKTENLLNNEKLEEYLNKIE